MPKFESSQNQPTIESGETLSLLGHAGRILMIFTKFSFFDFLYGHEIVGASTADYQHFGVKLWKSAHIRLQKCGFSPKSNHHRFVQKWNLEKFFDF